MSKSYKTSARLEQRVWPKCSWRASRRFAYLGLYCGSGILSTTLIPDLFASRLQLPWRKAWASLFAASMLVWVTRPYAKPSASDVKLSRPQSKYAGPGWISMQPSLSHLPRRGGATSSLLRYLPRRRHLDPRHVLSCWAPRPWKRRADLGIGEKSPTWVWGSLIVKWCPLSVRGGMTRAEKVVRSGSLTYSSLTYVPLSYLLTYLLLSVYLLTYFLIHLLTRLLIQPPTYLLTYCFTCLLMYSLM